MYKTKIFDEYCVEDKLAEFLNENKILREQIVSISMSSDSKAHARLGDCSVDRILLVWNDDVIYKTKEEKATERATLKHSWEEQQVSFDKAMAELQALLDKY